MNKDQKYIEVTGQIMAVTEGERNIVACMATICCLLSDAFDDFFWTGFYLVDEDKPDELVIGPYQGSLGCLRIAVGRGVCGTAAATGQTQVVDNVHDFPGAKSLIAVLDVDSEKAANFDESDRRYLEQMTGDVFARCTLASD